MFSPSASSSLRGAKAEETFEGGITEISLNIKGQITKTKKA